jgi:hypothetical protein
MHLSRCQAQKSQSLEVFYTELRQNTNGIFFEINSAMIDLVQYLQKLKGEERVFGLTSHTRLLLLAEDKYDAECYVRISALDNHSYIIEYLMPERFSPWPQAYVQGKADSLERAAKMVLTAMRCSEGWNFDDDVTRSQTL